MTSPKRLLLFVSAAASASAFPSYTNDRHMLLLPSHSMKGRIGDQPISDISKPNPTLTTATALRGGFIDLPTTFSVVNQFYKTMPFTAAFVTCGLKASLADRVAQKRELKQVHIETTGGATARLSSDMTGNDIDIQRNIAFLLYGGMYQGVWQEHLFNHLYPIWFGESTGVGTVVTKVLVDLLILTPFLCLPVAYLIKCVVSRYPFSEGLTRYWNDVRHQGLVVKYWAVWGPVQCLTFSVVPRHLRISFIALVSFFWLIVLSSISASKKM